jgi:hypothetical protein
MGKALCHASRELRNGPSEIRQAPILNAPETPCVVRISLTQPSRAARQQISQSVPQKGRVTKATDHQRRLVRKDECLVS